MEREHHGVCFFKNCHSITFTLYLTIVDFVVYIVAHGYVTGIKVTCAGNTGHGSRFITDNAAEKMVGFINERM